MKLTAHDARKLTIKTTTEYTETKALITAGIAKAAANGRTSHDYIMELEQSIPYNRNMMLAAAYALVDDFKADGYEVIMDTTDGPNGEIAEIEINWN